MSITSLPSIPRHTLAAIAVGQALWLLAAGFAPAASAAGPVAAARAPLAIPAGPLEQVLARFGQETGTIDRKSVV